MSKLLIADHPLQLLPKLAVAVGLSEAIFLQQLHYWIQHKSSPEKQGRRWHYESYEQWLEQFPFWSLSKIKRIVERLRDKNLIITEQFQSKYGKQTLWYSINYDELEEYELLITIQEAVDKEVDHSVKMTLSGECQNDTSIVSKWNDDIERETKQRNYFKETNSLENQESVHNFDNSTNVFYKKLLIPQIRKKLKSLQSQGYLHGGESERLLSEVLYHVLHRNLDKTVDDQHAMNSAMKKIKERKWTTPRGMLNESQEI